MRKTKDEITAEVVAHIGGHGPCVGSDGVCRYYFEGNSCAFGLFLEDEYRNDAFATEHVAVSAESLLMRFGQRLLKPEYRGHDGLFWRRLQALHDVTARSGEMPTWT